MSIKEQERNTFSIAHSQKSYSGTPNFKEGLTKMQKLGNKCNTPKKLEATRMRKPLKSKIIYYNE